MRRRVALWVLSAIVLGAAVGLTAQAVQVPRADPPNVQPGPPSRVLTDGDVGFRVESIDKSGRAVGRFVVKVNGEWVEVVETLRASRVTQ